MRTKSKQKRRFRNLSMVDQIRLNTTFPDIENIMCGEETENYSYMAVSVFDHWLGEEDANLYLSDVSQEEQAERNAKFTLFSSKLISNTPLLNFVLKGRGRKTYPKFREFTSESAKYQYMASSPDYVGSNLFFKVAIPDFKALCFESWDDTNVFYLRDERARKQLAAWAEEYELYCLDKW